MPQTQKTHIALLLAEVMLSVQFHFGLAKDEQKAGPDSCRQLAARTLCDKKASQTPPECFAPEVCNARSALSLALVVHSTGVSV